MHRTQVLQLLAESKPTLVARFGLLSLALFGSTSQEAAGDGSEIGILVSFDGPSTSEQDFGVPFFLEDLLRRPNDLATDKAPRSELWPYLACEAVHV